MRVRFWGTRGSIATAGPGTIRFGGNTSCVELTTDAGELLIFDCGTGARFLGAELMATAPKPIRGAILFGHTHWDHIQGFPFFTPVFAPGNEFALYGPQGSGRSLHDVLAGQMEFSYFPVELNQLPASISFHELAEGAHQIGGARVLAQYLHHPAVTLGYRIETDGVAVAYLVDHEPFSEPLWRGDAVAGSVTSLVHEGDRRHARFMAEADLVIHDAQYTLEEYRAKKTWGHSPVEYVVEVAAAAGVRRLALTHHDPAHDDVFVAEVERRAREVAAKQGSPMEVFCAYEGCDLTVTPGWVAHSLSMDAAPRSSGAQSHGARILVVDDEAAMRQLVKRGLTQDGFTVTEATSGAEALGMVEKLNPDLIVLDVVMPQQSGTEVLKALRSKPSTAHLPVILLTALGDEQSTRAGFEVGATDYLTKPFSIPQLTARVRACLARAARR